MLGGGGECLFLVRQSIFSGVLVFLVMPAVCHVHFSTGSHLAVEGEWQVGVA